VVRKPGVQSVSTALVKAATRAHWHGKLADMRARNQDEISSRIPRFVTSSSAGNEPRSRNRAANRPTRPARHARTTLPARTTPWCWCAGGKGSAR